VVMLSFLVTPVQTFLPEYLTGGSSTPREFQTAAQRAEISHVKSQADLVDHDYSSDYTGK
jgi:hypothetical protein